MSIDLEDQLRQAYGRMPETSADPTDVIARSRRTAVRSRRRRTAGVCAGAVAAALAVGAVAAGGPLVMSPGRAVGILPAGGSTSTPTFVTSSATAPSTATHDATGAPHFTVKDEGSDKPLAGLSGKLLPHGSQLPPGVVYRGSYVEDADKTWTTSRADGYAYGIPVPIVIAAKQERNSPSLAATNATYGMVSTVFDQASTSGPDTSPKSRSLGTNIVRFRTPEFAQDAISKAQRKHGGLYWVDPALSKPNVAWSGVPGVSGDHGVYNCAGWGPAPIYVAYQVVGSYIVSANSETAATAEQAVTDMVGNLATAGLLK